MPDIKLHKTKQDPYLKSKHNIGFIGLGPHAPTIKGRSTSEHARWGGIIDRGYCEKIKSKHPTYADCGVDEQWHNFQEFAEWCQWQKGSRIKGWELDKDILVPGNKTYGPDTCCFVPAEINSQFRKMPKSGELPSGVTKISSGKYILLLSKGITYAGVFDSYGDALLEFNRQRELKIRGLAEKYKLDLDERVYYRLSNFSIVMTQQLGV
jgi:hypothetical protein